MRRRHLLIVIGGSLGLGGCLSRDAADTDGTVRSLTTSETRDSPSRRTSDGITATFQVTDSHAPTEDTSRATFEDNRVTVTGSMNPVGCNRPVLGSVHYNVSDRTIQLVIGGKSPYGPTATVVCGNASFDYRAQLTVEETHPAVVHVVHVVDGSDDQTFTLARG